jgi:hypothetical protein
MTTYVVGGLVDRESVALSSFYIVPGRRLIQNVARLGVDFAAPWIMASAVWRNGHGRRATFVQPSHEPACSPKVVVGPTIRRSLAASKVIISRPEPLRDWQYTSFIATRFDAYQSSFAQSVSSEI